jgi:cytochrome c556
MRSPLISVLGLITIGLFFSGPLAADDEQSPYSKYRHAVMETMKGHITALSMVAFGQLEDTGFMQSHADSLASAAKELDVIFPAGSGAGSEALPAVWEQADKFAAAVDASQTATAELQAAVASGNRGAVAGAFKKVGDACKGCHEGFRAESD